MKYESNIDDPGAMFSDALASFGLDSHSRAAPTVGQRATATVAERFHDRAERFEGPDGKWLENAPSTIARKGRDAPNHDSDAMMSMDEISGEVAVTKHEADITYGKTDECRLKAHFAETGAGVTKVVRRFFWMTSDDADAVRDGVADDLMDHLAKG